MLSTGDIALVEFGIVFLFREKTLRKKLIQPMGIGSLRGMEALNFGAQVSDIAEFGRKRTTVSRPLAYRYCCDHTEMSTMQWICL